MARTISTIIVSIMAFVYSVALLLNDKVVDATILMFINIMYMTLLLEDEKDA